MDVIPAPGVPGPDYEDEILDAGWLPQPEAVAPEPESHPPASPSAAREDADAFLQTVYRNQS
ncbi:MAG: hypothetical protein FHP94_14960 [Denitromonas halophila]|jgi:hypothetical protein|nr:MAG: hypothetical protein FHP94_14960 [Denitromonas halophila]TVT67102.1 MAG: hypothetical protein FHP93_17970 [Denitromonas halophila]